MLVEIFKTVLSALRSVFRSRAALLAENVVLRQQIIVLQRSVAKPRIRRRDRIVLAFAARMFDIHAQIVETDFEAGQRAHPDISILIRSLPNGVHFARP
jgi:hypothetical protein